MSQPDIDVIAQAQEYIRSNQLPKAQRLLVGYLKQNPNSEQAWYVLSTAVDDPRRQIECLQRVLRINPANTEAQTRLMAVMTPQAAPPSAATAVAAQPSPAIESIGSELSAQQTVPLGEPELAEPEPAAEVARPIEPAAVVDTELLSLRSKAKFVKPRKPRKRWPHIVILLLLILVAASVGSYLLLNSFNQANPSGDTAPAEAVVAVPTDTPAPTATPTVTPTPSITPTRYPSTWTPTPAPTAPPTRLPTPIPTFDPAVQVGLQRLRDQVSTQRGLDTGTDIPTALLPRGLVESTLKSILDLQQRQPELVNQARGLAALGLIRPGFDLTRYTINRFADNAGGFAIPWQNVVNVAGTEFGDVERIVYAHLAAHALLDKRFNFMRWGLYPACIRGDEQCHALQALIEGDASLITDRWLEKDATDLSKDASEQYRVLPPAVNDPSAPPFVVRDTAFRSEQGRKFVEALYRRGGWAAVNEAYGSPPASTEHILHPEKFFEGEEPIEVAAAPLTGILGNEWQLIADEVLGEWRTYLLLSANVNEAARLSEETAQAAAAGWGGDRYRVYYDPQTDQSALAVEWRWDSPQDAAEFQRAMSTYLDLRFRGAKSQDADQDCWSSNQQVTCLYATENGTLWVLAPEYGLVDQIRQAHPAFK